ncbi:MAG: hypothetical protein QXL94_01105 [Candidatus Parvarchaeum sp.]
MNATVKRTKPYVPMTISPVEATWKWEDQSQGLVTWTFKNPNNVTVSCALIRGLSSNGSPPENIYVFGDAFYPLYYYDFGTVFQNGQPIPLTPSVTQPPLAVFKTPNGNLQVGFIFTIKANGTWSMIEGGFVGGYEPAGVSTAILSYVSTEKFNINYNVAISCEQYNLQAGTNYACPPNPFTVESALFNLPVNIAEEVPSDSITPVTSGGSSGGSSTSGSANIQPCVNKLINGIEGGSFREVIQAIQCFIDSGALNFTVDEKRRIESLKHLF